MHSSSPRTHGRPAFTIPWLLALACCAAAGPAWSQAEPAPPPPVPAPAPSAEGAPPAAAEAPPADESAPPADAPQPDAAPRDPSAAADAPVPDVPAPDAPAPDVPAPEAAPTEAAAPLEAAGATVASTEASPESPSEDPEAVAFVSAAEASADPDLEVVVAGSRVQNLAGSAHVIGQRQLERFEYDDANAIVQQVPGVYVRQEDGVGLRPNIGIRGVNPDRSKKLTLMEDGILFGPAPYSAPAAYYFPLMTRMTQVRVIKGPGAIAYGPQTVGGAIDLMTRRIEHGTHGGADLGLGMYGYGKLHAHFSHADDRAGLLVEGVRLGNSGFKSLPDGGDTGFTRNEWMGKAFFVLDPTALVQNRFELKVGYSDEASNETYLGLSDADFREDPLARYPASALDRMENHRTSFTLSHVLDGDPATRLKLTTSYYRNDLARSWRKVNAFRGASISEVLADPDSSANAGYYGVLTGEYDSATSGETLMIGPNRRVFSSQGLQSIFNWSPKTGAIGHAIEAGVRLHNDSIGRHHSQDGFVMIGGELYPDGTPTEVTTVNFEETLALAVHASDALTWGPVVLTPGLRVEALHQTSDDQITGERKSHDVVVVLPGLGAFWAITDHIGLLAGAYRGFSPPAPSSAPEPESSINYEAGARAQTGPLRAELIGFYNDYSNMTDICTFASGCSDDNEGEQFSAGASRVYGFETFVKYEPKTKGWTFPMGLSYTLTRGEFLTDFESGDPIFGVVEAFDEVPYLPLHQGNVSLSFERAKVGMTLAATYVSAMREEAGKEPLADAMHTDEQFWLDVGGYVRPLEWLEIYANLRNALDDHYIVSRRPYGARPNAPRWMQLGVKAKF